MNTGRLFLIRVCGDPYNPHGWEILEFCNSFDEGTCTYRGDLSPSQGRERTIAMLRRMYPGCKIRVERG